jgi:hypothetical protein
MAFSARGRILEKFANSRGVWSKLRSSTSLAINPPALAAIIADEGIVEIAVKRPQCISLTYYGSVDNGIIIRSDDTTRGAGPVKTTCETPFALK